MIKKIIAVSLACILALLAFTACSGGGSSPGKDGKLTIVCTMFPMYDWVRNILGDKLPDANLVLLLDEGTDFHSYQPTAQDLITIGSADVFVYIGGESDKWVDEIKNSIDLSETTMFSLLEQAGNTAVEEETVEGMQPGEEEEEEGEVVFDEHIWMSLKKSKDLCGKLARAIGLKDSDNLTAYEKNALDYGYEMSALDKKMESIMNTAHRDTIVVADRFPFRYLCDDYNIKYYAAFSGCSAETEASFATVSFLAEKINENELESVIITETSDGSVANTVCSTSNNADMDIITINAMQSVTAAQAADASYCTIMSENISALAKALY